MDRLFGTDGIRGVANVYPMDAGTAVAAGRAVAEHFRSPQNGGGTILIGQDTRLSGDMIAHAVSAGVLSAGMDAALLGVMPTPAVAYLVRKRGAAAGVVISASHNPYFDNGIKLFNSGGFKLSDEEEAQIEARLRANAEGGRPPEVAGDKIGTSKKIPEGLPDYIDFLMSAVPGLDVRGMKLVLDCANGATSTAGPVLFRGMGAEVSVLSCEPDGININDRCGSQHPETLARAVVGKNADMGLAFDGDGDRLIAVDETGHVLSGDQIIAICAGRLQKSGRLKNSVVVTTVMSNMGLRLALERMGVELATTAVGDRHVMLEMLRREAVLGGEDSGHIIFRESHSTGDGMMAALKLIDAVREAGRPLSHLAGVMEIFPQELVNVDVASKPDLEQVPEVAAVIRDVERRLGGRGRVLVRYSGTQPKCRVMVEGPTVEETRTLCGRIADVIRDVLGA